MATQPLDEEQSTTSRAVALSPQRESYAIMKDQARLFSVSKLLPEAVRGNSPDEAMANCLIALQMAQAMNELPFMVMQNIHIVKGKAGFAAQFMIARANASGVFKGRINWDVDKSDANNLSVTAYAYLSDTGERVEFTVDMKMAQAEQWTKNEKYKSIPELMLRYRSATFLVRLYCPDVMLGYRTADELEDMSDMLTPTTPTLTGDMLKDQARPVADAGAEPEVVEGEVVEPEPPSGDGPTEEDLDQQRREDEEREQTPEVNDTASEPHPAAAKAEDIIAEIKKQNAVMDVGRVLTRHQLDIAAMPEAMAEAINAAADQHREAIRAEQAKAKESAE
jgi:hypothetical protein